MYLPSVSTDQSFRISHNMQVITGTDRYIHKTNKRGTKICKIQ